MARSLNKVMLIGRLGADPELRTTSTGMQVASFSLATNRQWNGQDGTAHDETDWHNIVAWDRLAQVCNDHLTKGRLVYIEGRIRTRTYETNGVKQYRTEIVASDMLMLDPANALEPQVQREEPVPARSAARAATQAPPVAAGRGNGSRRQAVVEPELDDPEDLPF
jgi:single-strand DNA-binding protein